MVAAANGMAPTPQIRTRHREPVAAVVSAVVADGRPPADRWLDLEKVLRKGGHVLLEFDPDELGSTDGDREVLGPPEPGGFT